MKTIFILVCSVILASQLHGQQIQFSGGYCSNHFTDYKFSNEPGHTQAQYKAGTGYAIGLSYQDYVLDSFKLRFDVRYINYDGHVYTRDGGNGSWTEFDFQSQKNILAFDFYPLNYKIFNKRLDVNIGAELNYLLSSKMTGNRISVYPPTTFDTIPLPSSEIDYNSKLGFGIVTRFAYDIAVSPDWYFVPEYSFYLGLSNEFHDINSNTKSYRHYFTVALGHKL